MDIARASIRRRPWTLWLLVAALMVYGCNGALVQIVGPAHRHVSASVSADGASRLAAWTAHAVQAVRAWRARIQERLPITGRLHALKHAHARGQAHSHRNWAGSADLSHAASAAHLHGHDQFVRHHHDVGDASVLALDGQADDGSAHAAAGAATLTLALAPRWSLPGPLPAVQAWGSVARQNWSDAALHRIERPPRG